MKVFVEWDTEVDGKRLTYKEAGLTEIIDVSKTKIDEIKDENNKDTWEEAFCDHLSGQYGYCILSWRIVESAEDTMSMLMDVFNRGI